MVHAETGRYHTTKQECVMLNTVEIVRQNILDLSKRTKAMYATLRLG
jgi:hypothetical protein